MAARGDAEAAAAEREPEERAGGDGAAAAAPEPAPDPEPRPEPEERAGGNEAAAAVPKRGPEPLPEPEERAGGNGAAAAAVEPGPEPVPEPRPGRGQLFAAVIDTFLEKLLAAGSYQRFASCYRDLHRLQPALTRGIYEQFVAQLRAAVQEEIQDVKDEGNLEALFNALDTIVEQAEGRDEPAWRPSGLAEEDARGALLPFLLKHRGHLCRALRERQDASRELARTVLAGRDRIAELQRLVRERKEAWQAASLEQRQLLGTLEEPRCSQDWEQLGNHSGTLGNG